MLVPCPCTWNYLPSHESHLPRSRDSFRLSCLLAQAMTTVESTTDLIELCYKTYSIALHCYIIQNAASFVVTIDVVADDYRLPPIIQHGPQNQTLPINSIATLFCSVSGDPMPNILWLKNGRVLPMADSRFTIIDGGTLQISGMVEMDTEASSMCNCALCDA